MILGKITEAEAMRLDAEFVTAVKKNHFDNDYAIYKQEGSPRLKKGARILLCKREWDEANTLTYHVLQITSVKRGFEEPEIRVRNETMSWRIDQPFTFIQK